MGRGDVAPTVSLRLQNSGRCLSPVIEPLVKRCYCATSRKGDALQCVRGLTRRMYVPWFGGGQPGIPVTPRMTSHPPHPQCRSVHGFLFCRMMLTPRAPPSPSTTPTGAAASETCRRPPPRTWDTRSVPPTWLALAAERGCKPGRPCGVMYVWSLGT